MDEFIDELLADGNKQEALVWLKGSTDECERLLGEMTNEESLSMIQELYSLGQTKAWAVEIDEDDDLEGTGKLVLELPTVPEERERVIAWGAEWATQLGFDPTPDTGQSHLFVMLD